MGILMTIGLVIFGIIILIGIIRVMILPYTGLVNMLMEMMLLDCLGSMFWWVINNIWDND
jgi:hypothetical protein